MSRISLPVTLLLAVTVFFARMSGNNEVIALKALGIPPRTFLIPVFVIAAVISVLGVRINELAVTWGQRGINAVIYRAAEEILIGKLREEKRFDTDDKQITILVGGVDEQRRLIKPTIMLKRGTVTISTITAESAEIKIDFTEKILTIIFEGMKVSGGGTGGVFGGAFSHREFRIPLSKIVPTGDSNRPAELSLDQISEEKKRVIEEIEQHRRIIAAHRTFIAVMGSVDAWAKSEEIEESKKSIRLLNKQYDRLSVEPPRRWATGFSCFFFVWLGAPLAIWMRKSDFFSSFFACFVPILILYYPLLMFGLTQAKNGALPPMCVWLANGGIGLIGLWFLRQIHRY
jgi:lipopolysaccharide export system permease protein